MNPSTAEAATLVDELIAGGITDAVLCPGSRNAPLSLALHSADAAGRIRLHVRIDERGAGFLALGLARASGRPAVVVTTSGTAVANLHPAVLEAHHGAVPLIVLSADRPPELRGVGANQVIDQMTVFDAGVLRFRHDFAVAARKVGQNAYWRSIVCRALAQARGLGAVPGPVQLNVPLAPPLVPDGPDDAPDWPEPLSGRDGPWTAIHPASHSAIHPVSRTPILPDARPDERCLVVAALGADIGPVGASLPVVAEAGGLAGAGVLRHGVDLLAALPACDDLRPDRVIVVGRPTLFRQVGALLADPRVTVDVVDHPRAFGDVAGTARTVSAGHGAWGAGSGPNPWLAAWRAADSAAESAVQRVLADRDLGCPAVLARTVSTALPDDATVVLGSSQPPRDIARFAAARGGIRLVANRGVAGIDGTVSTAIGAALAETERPTYALMGDLTFLHDVTALALGPHEPRPDLTIIVANNDGGGIFATLEQGAPDHAGAFERVFGTPTGAEIARLAEGFGVDHVLASTVDQLADQVSMRPRGLRIVEVRVRRSDLRELLTTVASAVRAALAE